MCAYAIHATINCKQWSARRWPHSTMRNIVSSQWTWTRDENVCWPLAKIGLSKFGICLQFGLKRWSWIQNMKHKNDHLGMRLRTYKSIGRGWCESGRNWNLDEHLCCDSFESVSSATLGHPYHRQPIRLAFAHIFLLVLNCVELITIHYINNLNHYYLFLRSQSPPPFFHYYIFFLINYHRFSVECWVVEFSEIWNAYTEFQSKCLWEHKLNSRFINETNINYVFT